MVGDRTVSACTHLTGYEIEAAFIAFTLRAVPDEPVAFAGTGALVYVFGEPGKMKVVHV